MQKIACSPWLIAGAALALSAPGAWATTTPTPISAVDSAEVTTAGPVLSGFYHDNTVLNVEGAGNTNDSNAPTFGVIDFANLSPDPSLPVLSVAPNFTLQLVDTPTAATAPGLLDFYLVPDNTTSLDTLTYGAGTPNGLGSQLGTPYFLGSGSYASTGSTLTYNLSLPSAATSYVLGQFNNPNGDLRLAITTDTSGTNPNTVGATFAGAGTSPGLPFQYSATAPTLTFNVTQAAVPEANTSALLLVGLLGIIAVGVTRRRKTA